MSSITKFIEIVAHANTESASRGILGLGTAAETSAAKGERASARIKKSVSRVGSAAVLASGAAIGASVKMAINFQASTQKLVSSAGESEKNLGLVRNGIEKIAVHTGTSLQNLSEGMYTVESAGYHGAKGLTILKAAAEGARAEQAPLSDVTDAVTTALKDYHLPAKKAADVTSAMVAAVGHGKTTFPEFTKALHSVQSVAAAAGISMTDLYASMATLTMHGVPAQQASQNLAFAIRGLQNPSMGASNLMSQLGLSSTDVSKNLGKRGLAGTVKLLNDAILKHMGKGGLVLTKALKSSSQAAQNAQIMFNKLPPGAKKIADAYQNGKISLKTFRDEMKGLPGPQANLLKQWQTMRDKSQGFNQALKNGSPSAKTYTSDMQKMMGGAAGLNVALMLASGGFQDYNSAAKPISKTMKTSHKEVKGFSEVQKTTAFQMSRFKESVEVLAVKLGTVFLPILTKVFTYLANHQQLIKGIAIAIAAIAALKIGASVANSLYSIGKAGVSAAKGVGKASMAMAKAAKFSGKGIGKGAQLFGKGIGKGASVSFKGIKSGVNWAKEAAGIAKVRIATTALAAKTKIAAGASKIFAGAQKLVMLMTSKSTYKLIAQKIAMVASKIAMVAVKVATAAWAAVQWVLDAAMNANPIGLIIIAVIALAAAAYVVYRNWKTISNFFTGTLWPWLKRIGNFIKNGFLAGWHAVANFFKGPFLKPFKKALSWITNTFGGPFKKLGSTIAGWVRKGVSKITSAWDRLKSGIQHVWNAIKSNVFNPIKNFFTKTIPGWVEKLVARVKLAFHMWVLGWKMEWNRLIRVVLIPIKNFFVKTIPSWAGTLVGKIKNLWQQISNKIRGVKDYIVGVIGGSIRKFFTQTIPSWTGTLVGKIKSLWQQISNKIRGVRDYIVNVIGGSIRKFFTQTIPRWTGTLVGKIKQLWQQISNKIRGVKDYIVNVIGGAIRKFFTQTIPRWTGTLVGKIKDLWQQISDKIKSVKDFVVHKIGGSIYDFFVRKIPSWTGTLVGKIKSLWTDAANGVQTAWNKVKGYAAKPLIFVVETVFKNGLLKAWDTIAGLVPGMKKATKLESALGTVIGKLKKYRTGGAIYGPGTGTSDSVPIWASRGEHMWTAKEVQAVGGHAAMMSLRAAALKHQLYPAYANGGPISHAGAQGLAAGGIVAAGKGISPYTIPRLITEIAQKIQPSAHMTSGYRPGSYSLEGNRDYHSQGKAADLVSNNMNALAAAFYGVKSYLLEEIHTRYGSNTGWYVKNGHAVSNSFYGAEVPIHRDHVHIAMTYASAMSLLNQMKGKHGSSFLDKIKSFGGSLLNLATGNFFLDWIKDVLPKFNPVKSLIDKIPGKGTVMGDGLRGAASGVLKFAEDAVKSLVDDANSSGAGDIGGGKYHGGGNVSKWLHEAMALTHVGESWYPMLYRIAMRESRGNPNAINNYDINAKRGDPSEGMMQIIISNFKRFHLPGHGNIWNPVDNAAAAIQYIKAVYGNPANTPRNYYARGTSAARHGWAWVGENGPELINFNGGESVFPGRNLGGNVNIEVHIHGSLLDVKDVAKQVAEPVRNEVVKALHRNGKSGQPLGARK